MVERPNPSGKKKKPNIKRGKRKKGEEKRNTLNSSTPLLFHLSYHSTGAEKKREEGRKKDCIGEGRGEKKKKKRGASARLSMDLYDASAEFDALGGGGKRTQREGRKEKGKGARRDHLVRPPRGPGSARKIENRQEGERGGKGRESKRRRPGAAPSPN